MPMASRMETLRAKRITERQRLALDAARNIIRHVENLGCRAWLFGSLATGRCHEQSDIDILVDCPGDLKYRLESDALEIAGGINVDIAYMDELREPRRSPPPS